MQHFPRISEPHNPIRVPYTGAKYRGGNYETYLADHDLPFDLERIQQHDFGHHSRDAVAQILQAWLYFGLLSEAMQLDVIEEDFVEVSTEREDEQKLITTEKLRDYIHRWRAAHENAKANPSELARRKCRTIEALAISHAAWSGFESFTAIVGPEIELSIQLLGCAIEHAVTSVYGFQADSVGDTWVQGNEAPWRRTTSPFVEERMRQMGWCPSVIRQLGSPCKLSLQTFVSLLKPSFSNGPDAHARCKSDDVVCWWKNVDEKTYKTKHVEGCKCKNQDPDAFLHVNEEDLRKILQDGEIPIVYLHAGRGESQPELKVVGHKHELQYTAISHVWADGLGNPRTNALPLCQIERILNFLSSASDSWMPVSKTPPTTYFDSVWKHDILADDRCTITAEELNAAPLYFWIDTLCVPPRPQDRELRKAAIKTMRAVYNRANRVFVFDADLLATRGTRSSLSDQEILARVTASSWLRRYWTLQEGLLAKNLLFQLAEEAVRIIQPLDQTESLYLHFYDNEIGYYAIDNDFMMRSRAGIFSNLDKVASIWSSINGRSTSHKTDEMICVATLLDMDLGKLLDVDENARTSQLWSMYTEFPLGVLCRPAEKLEDPRLSWAFTRVSDCATVPAPTFVSVTQKDEVLQFRHHGLVIQEQLFHSPISIIAVNIDGEVYFIRENLKSNNKPWKGIDFTSSTARFAVVLGQNQPRPIDGCLGALIKIKVGDLARIGGPDAIQGQYLRAVSVVKKGSQFDIMPTPARESVEDRDRETVYNGAWVSSEQEWEIRGEPGSPRPSAVQVTLKD